MAGKRQHMKIISLNKRMYKRIIMTVAGVTLGGFSVGLFKLSLFGTDPFQCFVNGISNVVSFMSFGTLYTIINLLMLIGIFFLDRRYIGIATFVNIFGIGYIVEFSTKFFGNFFGDVNLSGRIILLLTGIVLMCFASSLYYTSNLGVSTYDAVALILADKKIGKFKFIKIIADFTCVLIGVLLHAVVGPGTIVTAFFMGPLIEFFNLHFSRPLLERE